MEFKDRIKFHIQPICNIVSMLACNIDTTLPQHTCAHWEVYIFEVFVACHFENSILCSYYIHSMRVYFQGISFLNQETRMLMGP